MNTNTDIIRILAFGDSNTWGRIPGDDNTVRWPSNVRWTGILQNLLGNKYEVIEEGLNGRTTNMNSPHKAGKNGKKYLFSCLESQKPIDIIILALGKNDLKAKFNRTPEDIAGGLSECLEICKIEGRNINNNVPKILVISTAIVEELERERFGKIEIDFRGAKQKSIELSELYEKVAIKHEVNYLDISKEIMVSRLDGVHLDADQHNKLGNLIYRKLIDSGILGIN